MENDNELFNIKLDKLRESFESLTTNAKERLKETLEKRQTDYITDQYNKIKNDKYNSNTFKQSLEYKNLKSKGWVTKIQSTGSTEIYLFGFRIYRYCEILRK